MNQMKVRDRLRSTIRLERIDIALDVAIVAVALAIGLSVLVSLSHNSRTASLTGRQAKIESGAIPIDNVGQKMALAEDWSKAPQTLVLFLSTECGFCRKSLPFYSKISHEANRQKLRLVAVLPQDVKKSEEFLSAGGLKVDEIKVASPKESGVRATPTLILVDKNGIAADGWVGELSTAQQAILLARLNPKLN